MFHSFFLYHTTYTGIYTLSLHDALPISKSCRKPSGSRCCTRPGGSTATFSTTPTCTGPTGADRKSTRLNSSHVAISYAVFCLKKKTTFWRDITDEYMANNDFILTLQDLF